MTIFYKALIVLFATFNLVKNSPIYPPKFEGNAEIDQCFGYQKGISAKVAAMCSNQDSSLHPLLMTTKTVAEQCSRMQKKICQKGQVLEFLFQFIKMKGKRCVSKQVFDQFEQELEFYEGFCVWKTPQSK